METKLILNQVSHAFGKHNVIPHIHDEFSAPEKIAILGPNGHGKSTLLQIMGGAILPRKGAVSLVINGKSVEPDAWHPYVSFAAPYLDLPEDLTAYELLEFHEGIHKFIHPLSSFELLSLASLEPSAHKRIKSYSSGMKQRLKLLLAFFKPSAMILLDEPTSNLDAQGQEWYLQLIRQYTQQRLLIIASNDLNEYSFCSRQITWQSN